MKIIKIKDITKNNLAVSAADGELVFDRIVPSFESGEKVVLDFEGIELTITAFMNAAIGKLYGKYPTETIRGLLDIVNLQNEEKKLLQIVIEHAKMRFNKTYPTSLDNIDLFNED